MPGEFDAVNNLHRRERMDVHLRDGVLHGAQNVAVVKLGKIARQSALDADFGRAELPGFDGFLRHLVESKEICVRFARTAAEGAELASHKTDVGEIDIAIDHVGDDVAGEFSAQHIGRGEQAEQIVALRIRQSVGLFQRKVRRRFVFRELSQVSIGAQESGAARLQTIRAKGKLPVPTGRVRES